MFLKILLIFSSLTLLLQATELCYVTNGALMDRTSLRQPLKSSCDLRGEACFAFVPDIATMTVELGCAPKSVLPQLCFNKNFSCTFVSPFLHNDKTGFLCCCINGECNDLSKIDDLLPLPNSFRHEDVKSFDKWWRFPILILCFFAFMLLFGMIVFALVILKNITQTTITNNAIDMQMYNRIRFHKAEQLKSNQEIAVANVDVAVQELYHFLVHEKLTFIKDSDQKPIKKQPTQYIVFKTSLRTLEDLEKRVEADPYLQTPYPLSKNDFKNNRVVL